MKYLKVKSNEKLSGSNAEYLFAHFSLPAIATCPSAGECKKGCYATQGRYRFSNVQRSYQVNLELASGELFLPRMFSELSRFERLAQKQGKRPAVRIHTSGDFFTAAYFEAWLRLSFEFPSIQFYAYTKRVDLTRAYLRPFNFSLIYSEGGLEDSSIKAGDRHARVFPDAESLEAAGYDDASHDDAIAFLSQSGKIGLIYHGAERRRFSTGQDRAG